MGLDTTTREHVDACRRELPSSLAERKVAFGFDGVIDRVRTAVATRAGPEEYERMGTLEEFGTRIVDAAALDTSCSIEWFSERKRAGGHTAHLGRAMERLGHRPTIVGTYGSPPRETFTREYDRTRLVSLGEAPVTDAIEFDDGKVLLSETRRLANLDWEGISSVVGLNSLAASVDRTELLGLGYWATIPRMPTIWTGLREELWPRLRDPPRRVLVDPADIRRLSTETLTQGIASLRALDDVVPITVSTNRAEALRLANLGGSNVDETQIGDVTAALHATLGVSEVVVHAVTEAAMVNDEGRWRISIPREPQPTITTSAGDHFNAGLLVGKLAAVDGGAQLAVGSAVAGWFVRNGAPPTYDELRDFLDGYEGRFERSIDH
ncbi:PfkB family carbohydrate kinase [Halegenticoccus tardaugens]|uniref:PfkB family carbohydrate kinase n=1 Tax=Halegenticoccus tardaugens TaxID=2071624 RepID=UPI00100A67E7|nr:PfkB family carbohydrate kinase [Halegenticoccus tardaugens]